MITQIYHFYFSSFLHLHSLYFSCTLSNKSACLFYNNYNQFLLRQHSLHLNLFLNILFVIVSFLEAILLVCFLQAALFYNLGNVFLTTYFKHFVFMELFDLNSNLNNLSEGSSIKGFLVDSSVRFLFASTMNFCILPISTKTSKFSLSGLILINSQSSSFSIAFCLLISWSISLSLCPPLHQFLLQVYDLKNMHQFYSLKHYVANLFLQLKILL